MSESPKIDLSHAPLGERAAATLVRSVASEGDLAERHYLELKGPSDLNSKSNKQKVAKFILGAANRLPDRASEAFEGYGVMIIGITGNQAPGIPPIEMLELSKVVEPFLGASGPRWDVVRVSVDSSENQVLLILVDPPTNGQPPFICRASGDGLQSGRIYYRGDGTTREPTAEELDLLMARGSARVAAPVELVVELTERVIPLIVDDTRTLDEFIERARRNLIDALPVALKPKPTAIYPSALQQAAAAATMAEMVDELNSHSQTLRLAMGGEIPENRSKGEYLAEIETWADEVRGWWPTGVKRFVGYAIPACEVRVVNGASTFLEDVEISIHLEGPVEAIECERRSDSKLSWYHDLAMPRAPRKWGPTKRNFGWSSDALRAAVPVSPVYNAARSVRRSTTAWTNSGSVSIAVQVGDLRPMATFTSTDEESVLVLGGEMPSRVDGTWQATARGYDDIFRGELSVAVDEPQLLTDLLRTYLSLDDDTTV